LRVRGAIVEREKEGKENEERNAKGKRKQKLVREKPSETRAGVLREKKPKKKGGISGEKASPLAVAKENSHQRKERKLSL